MAPNWANLTFRQSSKYYQDLYLSNTTLGITQGNEVDLSSIIPAQSNWSLYPALYDIQANNHNLYNVNNTNIRGNFRVEGNASSPYWNEVKLDGNITTASGNTFYPPTNEQYFSSYRVDTQIFSPTALFPSATQLTTLQMSKGGTLLPLGDIKLKANNAKLSIPFSEPPISFANGTYRATAFFGIDNMSPSAYMRMNYDSLGNFIPNNSALIEINADSMIGLTELASSRIRSTAGKCDMLGTYGATLTAGTYINSLEPNLNNNYKATCKVDLYSYDGVNGLPSPSDGNAGSINILCSSKNTVAGLNFGNSVINIEASRYGGSSPWSATVNIKANDKININSYRTQIDTWELRLGTIGGTGSHIICDGWLEFLGYVRFLESVHINKLDYCKGAYPDYLEGRLTQLSNMIFAGSNASNIYAENIYTKNLTFSNISGDINSSVYTGAVYTYHIGNPNALAQEPINVNNAFQMGENDIYNVKAIDTKILNVSNINASNVNATSIKTNDITLSNIKSDVNMNTYFINNVGSLFTHNLTTDYIRANDLGYTIVQNDMIFTDYNNITGLSNTKTMNMYTDKLYNNGTSNITVYTDLDLCNKNISNVNNLQLSNINNQFYVHTSNWFNYQARNNILANNNSIKNVNNLEVYTINNVLYESVGNWSKYTATQDVYFDTHNIFGVTGINGVDNIQNYDNTYWAKQKAAQNVDLNNFNLLNAGTLQVNNTTLSYNASSNVMQYSNATNGIQTIATEKQSFNYLFSINYNSNMATASTITSNLTLKANKSYIFSVAIGNITNSSNWQSLNYLRFAPPLTQVFRTNNLTQSSLGTDQSAGLVNTFFTGTFSNFQMIWSIRNLSTSNRLAFTINTDIVEI